MGFKSDLLLIWLDVGAEIKRLLRKSRYVCCETARIRMIFQIDKSLDLGRREGFGRIPALFRIILEKRKFRHSLLIKFSLLGPFMAVS